VNRFVGREEEEEVALGANVYATAGKPVAPVSAGGGGCGT
jgi:hypothetical protein